MLILDVIQMGTDGEDNDCGNGNGEARDNDINTRIITNSNNTKAGVVIT